MNLPNILAFSRILLAPIFFFLLVNRSTIDPSGTMIATIDFFAALIFTIACITDFFDGYIARKYNQVTVLGEIIDPLADKMLMMAGFIGLVIIDRMDPWITYIILTREIFITGLRTVAVQHGISPSASFAGKSKTVTQMFAIGFLTMQWPGANIILYIALFLTIFSGYEYIKDFVKKVDIFS